MTNKQTLFTDLNEEAEKNASHPIAKILLGVIKVTVLRYVNFIRELGKFKLAS